MDFPPDWMPNIHPLIVHFPIAILILIALSQIIFAALKRTRWFEYSVPVFLMGVLSLGATYLSGRLAVNTVVLPANANSVLNSHADLALWTLIYFTILALVFLVVWWKGLVARTGISITLAILALSGAGLLSMTADFGGRLVYQHGVGTAAQNTIAAARVGKPASQSELIIQENGSWNWQPGANTLTTLATDFTWLEGSLDDITVEIDSQQVALDLSGNPLFITTGGSVGDIQIDLTVDLTDFDGWLKIVHHVSDRNNYDYFSIQNGKVELGRMQNSEPKIWSSQAIKTNKLLIVKVVGAEQHFRSYLNEKLVLHSHSAALPPGKVGLAIQGQGIVRIKQLKTQVLTDDDHNG